MFEKSEVEKTNFLELTKAARGERAQEKKKEECAIIVQSCIRSWLARKRIKRNILLSFDEVVGRDSSAISLKPAIEVYKVAKSFLYISKKDLDQCRFEQLCRYLIESLDSTSKSLSYVGLVMSKENAVPWVAHIKQLLRHCSKCLEVLNPESPSDMKSILVFLHTLISFTGTKTWKILNCNKTEVLRAGMNIICTTVVEYLIGEGLLISIKSLLRRGLGRTKVCLKHAALSASMRLALLPIQTISDKMLTTFLIQILSVPALLVHLQQISPECIGMLTKQNVLERTLKLLNNEQNLKIVFNALEGSYALCLIANIVQLAHIERDTTLKENFYPSFIHVLTWLLSSCQNYVVTKQSNLTHWHPILGWFSQKIDPTLQEALPHVKSQLYLLWSSSMVSALLGTPLAQVMEEFSLKSIPPPPTPQQSGIASTLFRHVTEHRMVRSPSISSGAFRLGSPESTKIALLCSMYQTTLTTLTQLRLDILTGLCYHDKVLYHFWLFFSGFGPNYGLRSFIDLLAVNTKYSSPEFLMLNLFCDCLTHYVTILDDLEMYEQQDPFKLHDFAAISNFLNQFLYKALSQNLFDIRGLATNSLFNSMHTLLLVLYRRDCRRRFTPDNHWLIKEIRTASFVSDLEKGKKTAQVLLQKMPHVIPQSVRVRMFKKLVSTEKAVCGLTESACVSPHSTLITVHRTRIVEDGYRQLALLPVQALKGVVRVRFVNEQGLDEAGIDQDGVFKEFLEETIKRVFDPSLNLFRATSEQRLYPSPTSHLQDHHLQLFEFVGRILGKAVYEGIVVDVPFASFFLSQLLGQPHQALYSSMDELPSLDPELYQSLTFIKHTHTDVQDLDLTFSVDEDCMGRLVTHELVPGGRAIPVTNENKINYIHLMAHFRMHTQIREQSTAFIRGFRSIINPEWLSLFSTPELQRLISGDNVPVDMKSLRKHTQYYGGFHDSHRVIIWLWDILEKDFNDEEKRLFLKFVTSCSKPPLLGFGQLEPPFSIRCVEVSDDEDPGDTVGSVIRGFFTIRKKERQNRLPTSSTCFNLLKLPNYQKKSTLREKLRYAVTSNTGFELS